jgi:hypothetical protein
MKSILLLFIFLWISQNLSAQNLTVSDSLRIDRENRTATLQLSFSGELVPSETQSDSLPFSFFILNPPDSIQVLRSKHEKIEGKSNVEVMFSITKDTYFSLAIIDAKDTTGLLTFHPYAIHFNTFSEERQPIAKTVTLKYSFRVLLKNELSIKENTITRFLLLGTILKKDVPPTDKNFYELSYPEALGRMQFIKFALVDKTSKTSVELPPSEEFTYVARLFEVNESGYLNSVKFDNVNAYNSSNETYLTDGGPNILGIVHFIVSDSVNMLGANFSISLSNNIEEIHSPQTFTLSNAYPNPFNPSTTITLSVIQPTKIRLSVFDVLGRNVPQLHTAESLFGSGEHQLSMDFSGLPSGLYFIEANGINLSNGNIEKSVLKVSLVK